MVNLCDPKFHDGVIDKIVDPTMGTAGFLTMAIKYLNKQYKVDWKKNINRIYGFDIDPMVKNMGRLNVWLETGENPTRINQCDTLKNDLNWDVSGKVLQKADVILANMPYGIKNIVHANCCKRIKDLKIRGTKAEPLFLQLFMEALNENGRCAVVVIDGLLFCDSSLHVDTRKHLIENFNLKKIIKLNGKFFLNTGVEASILYFINDGNKTSEVDFCEIKIVDEKVFETKILATKYDEIKKNNYYLFINKYNNVEQCKIKDISYKKLSDICDFLPKSKRHASYGSSEGKYPFYTSSQTVKRCNECDYNDKCIIIGTGGNANIKYDTNFSCSADNIIIKCKNVNCKYVFYFLRTNIKILESGFTGSTIKHISKEYVTNIEIPIPSKSIQNKIVEQFDNINDSIENRGHKYNKILNKYMTLLMSNNTKDEFVDICKLFAVEEKLCNTNKAIEQLIEKLS